MKNVSVNLNQSKTTVFIPNGGMRASLKSGGSITKEYNTWSIPINTIHSGPVFKGTLKDKRYTS